MVYTMTNLSNIFFRAPPFGCLKIFGAPPQYLHPPPLVILNELSLKAKNNLSTVELVYQQIPK